jgi:hypothetical protein
MANIGKVERVIRELVAVLVEELGPEEAAHTLEQAAAQVRGASYQPKQKKTTHAEGLVSNRQRSAANG